MQQLTKEERAQLAKVRQAKLEILFNATDKDSNHLIYHMGQLLLRNEKSDHNKKIGSIHYVNDTVLYSKWETTKDIFHKMDAWSIPFVIAKNVDVIWIQTVERQYWIDYATIKQLIQEKKVAILKFDGYEKKVYIPRVYFNPNSIIKAEKYEMTQLAHDPTPVTYPNMEKYAARVGPEWAKVLYDFFEKPYMSSIAAKLRTARASGMIIHPSPVNVFRAFRMTPYDKVKVVILGQDCYHDGNATGLAFDCGKNLTPSMMRIIDAFSEQFPNHFATSVMEGKLHHWASQGVFLLNTALTVRDGQPGSHLKQWSPFTQEVILQLNARSDREGKPVVYLLWGKMAQQYKVLIADDAIVIENEHPIAGAYKGNAQWQHGNCFLKANEALGKLGVEPVNWEYNGDNTSQS